MPQLILASTSIYRAQILKKLHIPFITMAPNIDEAAIDGEAATQLVARLAQQKAQAVSTEVEQGLVIGSDQVACLQQHILGKPGNIDNARQQLSQCAGKTVRFYTGLCVQNAATAESYVHVEPFDVHFRPLSLAQINYYLEIEQPFDCAGSFKSEGLGITLFRALEGRDPNALVGLPLIALIDLLAKHQVEVLQQAQP